MKRILNVLPLNILPNNRFKNKHNNPVIFCFNFYVFNFVLVIKRLVNFYHFFHNFYNHRCGFIFILLITRVMFFACKFVFIYAGFYVFKFLVTSCCSRLRLSAFKKNIQKNIALRNYTFLR